MRGIAAFFSILFFHITCSHAIAMEGLDGTSVQFAGAALIGNQSDSDRKFPFSSQILRSKNEKAQFTLDKFILDKIKDRGMGFLKSDLSSSVSESALAVSLVIVWENTTKDRVGGLNRLTLDLRAQILVFDFSSKKVLAAYPIATQYIDAHEGVFSDDIIYSKFKLMMYGDHGLVEQFVEKIAEIDVVERSHGFNIQVDVDSSSNVALSVLRDIGISESDVRDVIGFSFGRNLSEYSGAPIVPYYTDQAIGGKMATRFADASVYQFDLPEPDYIFTLSLRDYKSLLLQQSGFSRQYGFASYCDISLRQPLSGRIIFSGRYRFPIAATFTSSTTVIDEKKWFYEATLSLSDHLARSLVEGNQKWLSEWGERRLTNRQVGEIKNIFIEARK